MSVAEECFELLETLHGICNHVLRTSSVGHNNGIIYCYMIRILFFITLLPLTLYFSSFLSSLALSVLVS